MDPEIEKYFNKDSNTFVVRNIDFSNGANRRLLEKLLDYHEAHRNDFAKDIVGDIVTGGFGDIVKRDNTLAFENCDFSGVIFRNRNFGSIHFFRCDLSLADFSNVRMGKDNTDADYSHAWSGGSFVECNLTSTDFTNAKLTRTTFDKCNFHQASFEGTTFRALTIFNPENITSIKLNKATNFESPGWFHQTNAIDGDGNNRILYIFHESEKTYARNQHDAAVNFFKPWIHNKEENLHIWFGGKKLY